MSRFRTLQAALALLLALVATFSAFPARVAFAATTITDCSNPDAIEAQLEAGGDFVFNCGTVTITFNHPIETRGHLSVDGGGTTTFSIADTMALFDIGYGQLHLTLNRVTVTGARYAVYQKWSYSHVTITNSTFTNNATALYSSGGILDIRNNSFSGSSQGALHINFPYNDVTLADNTFDSNSAMYYGGALYVIGDGSTAITIRGGSFTNNQVEFSGGAIFLDNDYSQSELPNPQYIKVTIDGVSFSGNKALNETGGAVHVRYGDLVVKDSTFSNNTAGAGGGALYDRSTPGGWDETMLSISNSTFSGNVSLYGGGVTTGSIFSLDRSTFVSNSGGALLLDGFGDSDSAAVTNSTFSGNDRAIRNGDGFGNPGSALTVANSTFVGNGSSTVIATSAGTTTVTNSVIDASSGGSACSGTITSGGHNLASDASCAFTGAGDRNSTQPLLGPLANNGGSTQTHAPLPGSPAIDAGACPGVTTDQRGVTRPQGSACDIGAVEDNSDVPDTSFVNPPLVTGTAGGPFTFSSSKTNSTFECKVDTGTFSACSSPASFPGLPEGVHTLEVRAIDEAGRVDSTPASLTWNVDLTPPETTDVIGPGAFTNQATVSFTFSGTDAYGIAKFRCRFSGNGLNHDWKDCPNPSTYQLTIPFFLIVSQYWQLSVAAVDNAGNVDPTPITYLFLTDQWAPVTSLDSTPPKNSGSSSASFTFSAFDNMPTSISVPTFECKLDSEAFASCASPKEYSGLADGQHTFTVRAIDAAGNIDAEPQSYTWTIDSGPPETTLLTTPASVSNVTSPTFTFSGSDASGIARFECKLDGATFATCSSPANLSDLSDGSHIFEVRAVDSSGEIDPSPASYTWTIDTTAPETTLLTQPPAITSSTDATFTFSGSDATSVIFECKLDSAAFASCTNPAQYSGLSAGAHTFQVRASDAAGNVDATPASYTWTIDTTAPDTTIDNGPGPISSGNTATFTFSGSDAQGVARFECKLDSGDFTLCVSPLELSGLSDGAHTLQVRAIDNAGNVDPSPASHSWTVDTLAPETSIATAPPTLTNSTSADFTFSGSDANGVAGYECSLDGAAFSTCSSPVGLSGLTDGAHTFAARAIDNAGRSDASPATHTWTVDTTRPDTTLLNTPEALTRNTTAAFTFSGSDLNGVASFECALDGTDFAACDSPATYATLSDGAHTFQVRAVDGAGNRDPSPATFTWTVDTTAPDTTILLSPASLAAVATATFTFAASDLNGIAGFECKLDASAFAPCTSPHGMSGLNDGSHTFQVRALDNAGNTDATPAIYTWTVDTLAPDTTLDTAPASVTNSTAATFTFSGSDANGLAGYECALDGGVFSTCSSPSTLSGLSAGAHTFQVRAIDNAGRSDPTPATFTWTIDLTPPDTSISTGPSALSTNPAPAFSFTGSDQHGVAGYECALDTGAFAPCSSPHTLSGLSDGSHTLRVRANDIAGNTDPSPATYTWTVDTTAPASGATPSGSLVNGWYVNSVTLTLSASDANGIARISYQLDSGAWQTYTAPLTISSNGSHTLSYYAVDGAGNSETTRTLTLLVDTLAPQVQFNPTLSSTSYAVNSSVVVSYICSDADGAGIASCIGSVPSGSLLDTRTPGNRTITVTATDRVGKTTTQSVTYRIGYAFQVQMPGTAPAPAMNSASGGSPIYLKFSMGGNQGLNIFLTGYPKMQQINCSSGAPIGAAVALPVAGSGLQYQSSGLYQLIWTTQASWNNTCRQVQFAFNDGATYTLNFRFSARR